MTETPDVIDEFEEESTGVGRYATGLLLAFGIGAAVGIGLALTWIPEQPKRHAVIRGYRRARRAGGEALAEASKRSAELVSDFREELTANLEAARDELAETTRKQVKSAKRALEREYSRLRR